jgi:type IV secretory pathway TrbF-like protein
LSEDVLLYELIWSLVSLNLFTIRDVTPDSWVFEQAVSEAYRVAKDTLAHTSNKALLLTLQVDSFSHRFSFH